MIELALYQCRRFFCSLRELQTLGTLKANFSSETGRTTSFFYLTESPAKRRSFERTADQTGCGRPAKQAYCDLTYIFSIPPLFSDAAYSIEDGKRKIEKRKLRFSGATVFIQTNRLKQKNPCHRHASEACSTVPFFFLEKVHEEKTLFFLKTLANPVNMCYHIDRAPVIRLYKVVLAHFLCRVRRIGVRRPACFCCFYYIAFGLKCQQVLEKISEKFIFSTLFFRGILYF